jgi:hypothetical protein
MAFRIYSQHNKIPATQTIGSVEREADGVVDDMPDEVAWRFLRLGYKAMKASMGSFVMLAPGCARSLQSTRGFLEFMDHCSEYVVIICLR